MNKETESLLDQMYDRDVNSGYYTLGYRAKLPKERRDALRDLGVALGERERDDAGFWEPAANLWYGTAQGFVGGLRSLGNTFDQLGMGSGLKDAMDNSLANNPRWNVRSDANFLDKSMHTVGQAFASTVPGIALSAIPKVGPALSFAYFAGLHLGDAVERNKKYGLSDEAAWAEAVPESLVISYLENVFGSVAKGSRAIKAARYKKMLRGAKDFAEKQAIGKKILDLSRREIGRKAADSLWMRLGKEVIQNSAEEGGEEALQYLTEAFGGTFAQMFGRGDDFSKAWSDNFSGAELWENVKGGLIGGAGLAPGMMGFEYALNKGVNKIGRASQKYNIKSGLRDVLKDYGIEKDNRQLNQAAEDILNGAKPETVINNARISDTREKLEKYYAERSDDQVRAEAYNLRLPDAESAPVDTLRDALVERQTKACELILKEGPKTRNKWIDHYADVSEAAMRQEADALRIPDAMKLPASELAKALVNHHVESDLNQIAVQYLISTAASENAGNGTPAPETPAPAAPVAETPAQAPVGGNQAVAPTAAPQVDLAAGNAAVSPEMGEAWEGSDGNADINPETLSNPATPGVASGTSVNPAASETGRFTISPTPETNAKDQAAIDVYNRDKNINVYGAPYGKATQSDRDMRSTLAYAQTVGRATDAGKVVPVSLYYDENTGKPSGVNFAGVSVPNKEVAGRMLVNRDRNTTPAAMLHSSLHEITHNLIRNNPEAYRSLVEKILPLVIDRETFDQRLKEYANNRRHIQSEMSREAQIEEFICDLTADAMTTERFWMAAQKYNPTLAGKLLAALRQLLEKVKSILGYSHDQNLAVFGENVQQVIDLAAKFVVSPNSMNDVETQTAETAETSDGKTETKKAPAKTAAPEAKHRSYEVKINGDGSVSMVGVSDNSIPFLPVYDGDSMRNFANAREALDFIRKNGIADRISSETMKELTRRTEATDKAAKPTTAKPTAETQTGTEQLDLFEKPEPSQAAEKTSDVVKKASDLYRRLVELDREAKAHPERRDALRAEGLKLLEEISRDDLVAASKELAARYPAISAEFNRANDALDSDGSFENHRAAAEARAALDEWAEQDSALQRLLKMKGDKGLIIAGRYVPFTENGKQAETKTAPEKTAEKTENKKENRIHDGYEVTVNRDGTVSFAAYKRVGGIPIIDGRARFTAANASEALQLIKNNKIEDLIAAGTMRYLNDLAQKETSSAEKQNAPGTAAETKSGPEIKPTEEAATGEEAKATEENASESWGKNNKIISKDTYEEAKARILKRLNGRLNAGIDPGILADGVVIAAFHIEAGTRKFAEFAKKMIADLGDNIRPFLKSLYEGARRYPGMESVAAEMDPTSDVDIFDIENADFSEKKNAEPLKNADGGDNVKTSAQPQSKEAKNGSGDRRGRAEQSDGAVTSAAHDGVSERVADRTAGTEETAGVSVQDGTGILENERRERGSRVGDGGSGGTDARQRSGDVDAEGNRSRLQTVEGAGSEGGQSGRRVRSGVLSSDIRRVNANNFRITPETEIVPSGEIGKTRANIAAIRVLKKLEAENRAATAEEKAILAKYTGWGGLPKVFEWGNPFNQELRDLLTREEYDAARASTINAHYTSREVISEMWSAAARLGFDGGRVGEFGAGVGHFLGLIPDKLANKTLFRAVELDSITGKILKHLYPGADVTVDGLEHTKIPNNSLDMVIGNFPFAKEGPFDKNYPKFNLHNYFFARAIDAVKPGGIIVAVTSNSTLDSMSQDARKYFAERADFIGAIRLPNNAFKKNAGTDVVTDIIVLRKHDGTENTLNRTPFLRTLPVQGVSTEENGIRINEYFITHPEMILGKTTAAGSMYRAESMTVESSATPEELSKLIRDAVKKLPADIMTGKEAQIVTDTADITLTDEQKKSMREGEIFAGKLGELLVYDNGKGVLLTKYLGKTLSANEVKKIKSFLDLKSVYNSLMDAMRSDASDAEVKLRQAKLNAVYDAHVAKYGPISDTRKHANVVDDPGYLRMSALENRVEVKDENNPKLKKIVYEKSDIFTKRTVRKAAIPTHAESAADAAVISINYAGKLDFDFMEKLTGKSREELTAELLKSGEFFADPVSGQLVEKSEYLSGNIAEKIMEAEKELENHPELEANIKALKAVLPKPLEIGKISFSLGASWIPAKIIEKWLGTFNVRARVEYNAKKEQIGDPNVWKVSVSGASLVSQYQVGNKTIENLVQDALNLRRTKIYRYVDGKPTVDREATKIANDMQEELKRSFEDFVRGDAESAGKIEEIYNKLFNVFAERKIDPEKCLEVYPGAADTVNGKPFRLREHQRAVVSRCIRGNTLIAHCVGAGKTVEMITANMELIRLGLATKGLIVVQKSTLGQFAREAQQLYPNARILAADEKSMEKKNRRRFLSKIANGAYDMVIMAHSSFDDLMLSPELQRQQIQDSIDEVIAAIEETAASEGKQSPTVKAMERKRKSLQNRMEKLQSRENAEETFYFDELGFDAIFVDEAHAYKKLDFFTKLGNIKGLDRSASSRAFNMKGKLDFIRSKTGGRNIYFATGTPVTNTLAEVWNMIRMVNPEALEEFNVETFDQFAATFTRTVTGIEKSAGGTWKMVQRFTEFTNIDALHKFITGTMDIVLPEDLKGVKRPKIKGGEPTYVVSKPSSQLKKFMNLLKKLYEAFDAASPRERAKYSAIPLTVFGVSRKASIDMRLINENNADDPDSKLNAVVNNAMERYKTYDAEKGTQAIFCDLYRLVDKKTGQEKFNVYKEIKRKLIERGVPASEIAIITDYTTDAAKNTLFSSVNAGDVRFIMGSTEKLGTGVNIQERLCALHHIDAPMRPSDMEQRNGRIIRQGNTIAEPEIICYAVDQTLDSFSYAMLARKAKFINAALKGKASETGNLEVVEDDVIEYAAFSAQTSGDPRAVRYVELGKKLSDLESAKRRHQKNVYDAAGNIEKYTESAERAAKTIKELEDFIGKFGDIDLKTQDISLDGKKLVGERKEVMEQLNKEVFERLAKYPHFNFEVKIGDLKLNIGAKELLVFGGPDQFQTTYTIKNLNSHVGVSISGEANTAQGFMQSLQALLRKKPMELEELKEKEKSLRGMVEQQKAIQKSKFAGEEELDEVRKEHGKLEFELAEEAKKNGEDKNHMTIQQAAAMLGMDSAELEAEDDGGKESGSDLKLSMPEDAENTEGNGEVRRETENENKKTGELLTKFRDLARGFSLDNRLSVAAVRRSIENIASLPDDVKSGILKIYDVWASKKRAPWGERPISANTFVTDMSHMGFKRAGSTSAYYTVNGNSVRLAYHNATMSSFVDKNNTSNNVLSIVIEKPDLHKKFQEDNRVNGVEYVFPIADLTHGKLGLIIHDIAQFFATGEYFDHAGAAHFHTSGTETFKRSAQKKHDADVAAREEAYKKAEEGRPDAALDKVIASIRQKFKSGNTSLHQIAAGFRKIDFAPGTVNLDLGGGKFDAGTRFLAGKNVENLVFDPVNRDAEHNRQIFETVKNGGVDTVTCNNVLNVIREPEARSNVILQAAKALKPGGTAYFTVYEGNGSGVGRQSQKDAWQENRRTADYLDEIRQHFADVTLKDKVITARDPITDGKISAWATDETFENPLTFSMPSDGDFGKDAVDYRRKIDPLFDFIMEYSDNGVVNPGLKHEGEDFHGSTFISEAYRKPKPVKKALEQQVTYLARLEKWRESLANAPGTALDELAAAYVRKFGGDESEVEEKMLDLLRHLNRNTLRSQRADDRREFLEHEKEENARAAEEYEKIMRESTSGTADDPAMQKLRERRDAIDRESLAEINKQAPKLVPSVLKTLGNYFRDENGKPDLLPLEEYYRDPMHMGLKHPIIAKLFDEIGNAADNKNRILNWISGLHTDDFGTLKKLERNKADYKKVNDYLLQCDIDQTGAGQVREEDGKFVASDVSGQVIGQFDDEESAWNSLFAAERDSLVKQGFSEEAADAVYRFRSTERRQYLALRDGSLDLLRRAGVIDANATRYDIETVGENGKSEMVDVFELFREMGQRSGYYFPRIRHGRFMLSATKTGTNPVLIGFDSRLARAAAKWKYERQGYKVSLFVSSSPDQYLAKQVNPAALIDLYSNLSSRLKGKLGGDVKFEESTYTRKDGTKEAHFTVSGDIDRTLGNLLKATGGRFYGNAWHFVDADAATKQQIRDMVAYHQKHHTAAMTVQGVIGQALADMIRENSSRSHRIQRRDAVGIDVVKGYEEDMLTALAHGMASVAGGTSRSIMANNMYRIIAGMDENINDYIEKHLPELDKADPDYQKKLEAARLNAINEYYREAAEKALDSSKQPRLAKFVDKWIREMLRNTSGLERTVGLLKSFTAVKYLSRPSGAFGNLGGAFTTVPPVIDHHTKYGILRTLARLGEGYKLYGQYLYYNRFGKGKALTGEAGEVMDIIHRNGWDGAEQLKDLTETGLTFAAKGYKKFTDLALFAFGTVEEFNRAASIWSAYNALAAQRKIDTSKLTSPERESLVKDAKRLSDLANGDYSKANKLAFARGDDIPHQIGDMMMMFRTYEVNKWNNIFHMILHGNVKGPIYIATMLMLVAGVPASFLYWLVAKGIGAAALPPPDEGETHEDQLLNWLADNGWDSTASFLRYGISGAALGANTQGTFNNPVRDLWNNGMSMEMGGAPFSAIEDVWEAVTDYGNGRLLSGTEKLMPAGIGTVARAAREKGFGITDRHGRIRKDVEDKPIEMDWNAFALRSLGFNPVSISEKTDRLRSEKIIKKKYAEIRQEIYDKYRFWYNSPRRSPEELAEITKEIEAYNARVERSKRDFPKIDAKALKRAVK